MAKQVNINLSEKAVGELEELKQKLDLPSVAEVIRNSIAMQKFLKAEEDSGNEIVLRDKKTNKERVVVMRH